MVQIDVPVAFGVGCYFADAARRQLQSGDASLVYRTFIKHNIFQTFCFAWIPVYFLVNYFGWETTHMWWHADSVTAYPAFVSIFLLVFFIAGNAGFLLGARLVARGRAMVARAIYLAILAGSAVWILIQPARTFRLGSFADVEAGTAPWFHHDARFVGMLIFVMVVWITGLVVAFIHLRREGRILAGRVSP